MFAASRRGDRQCSQSPRRFSSSLRRRRICRYFAKYRDSRRREGSRTHTAQNLRFAASSRWFSGEPYVTLSLGVASIVPASESGPEILIAAADQALYQAKRLGRDRIQLYQPDPAAGKPNGTAASMLPVDFSIPNTNLPSPTSA